MPTVRYQPEHVRAVAAAQHLLQATVDLLERNGEHSPALQAHAENLEELHDNMTSALLDNQHSVSVDALQRRLRSVGA